MALLEIRHLGVEFPLRRTVLKALQDVSFALDEGERLGIVGESGAGKSVAAFSIINLLSKPGRISGGEILFEGRNLARMSAEAMRAVRGDRISMIFQDPMMTLNPVLTVETQMIEVLKAHRKIGDDEARRIAVERLREVAIPSPERRLKSYPHELSGGQRQRVVIAIALLTEPSIIIADEPTTALDVTIQAGIMSLMLDLCKSRNMSLILITHDLAVVSQVTERVIVMYAGRIVEQGPTADIIAHPRHPYTQGLLKALPQEGTAGRRLNQIPGNMPALDSIPDGCAFHPRCPHAGERCQAGVPDMVEIGRQQCRCLKAQELAEAV